MATPHISVTLLLRFAGLLAIICSIVATASTCSADDSIDFPYQAIVAKKDSIVRSGPGKVHYGTQKLSPGDVVEVYRHDPGGWCAIRPTQGSFCIVPESTVEITDTGIGKITADGTTPFVGTALGSVSKPLWQVKLREDENVAVLGQLSWPNPEGHSTIWYQIKPPAGEFRWIHSSEIQSLDQPNIAGPKPNLEIERSAIERSALAATQPPQNQGSSNINPSNVNDTVVKPIADFATKPPSPKNPTPSIQPQPFPATPPTYDDGNFANASAQQNQSSEQAASPTTVQQASFAEPINQPSPLQDTGSGWRKATRPMPNGQNFERGNRSSYVRSQQPARSTTISFSEPSLSQTSYPAQTRIADAAPNQSRFAAQLSQARQFGSVSLTPDLNIGAPGSATIRSLNNRLTVEMLKDPTTWNLASLEAATQQFLTTANPTERVQGQQFLHKLSNCQRIAGRYGAANQPVNAYGLPSAFTQSDPASSSQFASSQFDASGWLNELKQAGGTAPSTFVLQDAMGKIIFHVTPIPGLNINRYLKKKVGINGQRGFNQRLKLNHVTAERVFPL